MPASRHVNRPSLFCTYQRGNTIIRLTPNYPSRTGWRDAPAFQLIDLLRLVLNDTFKFADVLFEPDQLLLIQLC